MNLILKTPSDLTAWFEQEPSLYLGERRTMTDDKRTVERHAHVSELSMECLFSMSHCETEELENFDIVNFELTH